MTDTTEQAPGIGHNSAPIEEILADTQKGLLARVEPLAERANALPKKIASEDDLALVTPVVVDAKALAKDIETARSAEKKPYLDGGRAVDAFFKPHKDRLDRIVGVFERLASDFQREKIAILHLGPCRVFQPPLLAELPNTNADQDNQTKGTKNPDRANDLFMPAS